MTAAAIARAHAIASQEALGALPLAFHKQVERAGRGVDSDGIVALAAALLMRATLAGHICLSPEEIQEQAEEAGLGRLHLDDLRRALGVHPWVSDGKATTPMVFEGDRLYLRRFREAEVRLAVAIRERVETPAMDAWSPGLVARFRDIFPHTDDDVDWQAVAVAASLRARFTLITGGPGTGKTTTVANLLALLLEQNPGVRVALAAPTGKAATRLGEAIKQRWASMGITPQVQERLPSTGQTLHRLLGYRPQDDSFRHNGTEPLEHDVVIVDEASMVPLLLMDTLFAALRRDARVILLGDHDQLASVEAGSVLADLVGASGALDASHGSALGAAYTALSGRTLETVPNATPLRDAVVRLVRSHRFDDRKGIGALARAIRDGDADAALGVLQRPDDSIVRGPTNTRADGWLDHIATSAGLIMSAVSADAAIEEFGRTRVLCATNVGPSGTEAVIPRIEQALRKQGHAIAGRFYRGRPLLVTRNDYALGVFNGDIGVIWDELDGEGAAVQRAFIAGADTSEPARGFPLPQLPEAVTAWAMTVHKAQGSEFDTVVVVLPDTDVRVLSRELLYTAVSRARKRVIIVGPDEALRIAIGRSARRGSGMAARLLA